MGRFQGFIRIILGILLCGCTNYDRYRDHDPYLKLSREQFQQLLSTRDIQAPPENRKKIRKRAPVTPFPPSFRTEVTLSLTEDVPVKSAFMNLAQQGKINIALDPSIEGGVFFHAQKRPFIEVLQEICALKRLRFRIQGQTVRIEPDTPYWHEYDLQFLSLVRKHKNRISASTDVVTVQDASGKGLDNGSSATLSAEDNSDFWTELREGLDRLLNPVTLEDPTKKLVYTLHRQAGIITVYAPQVVQKQIEHYLKSLQSRIGQQVLIEAKILEIELNDEFKTGVNWQVVSGKFALSAPLGDIADVGPFDTQKSPVRNVFKVGAGDKSLTALANFLNTFGTVRTLSSPRLTVLNNQPALLKVATNQVFFRITYNREIGANNKPDVERAQSEIHTVPIGLIMLVHPTINDETGNIMMMVRPSITRIISEKEDPAVGILSNQTRTSKIPEVQIREISSVLKMNSGETFVLGGLMEEQGKNRHTGLPLDDVPVVEHLWSAKDKQQRITEIVILIRATILDEGTPSYAEADEHLYKTFSRDPRPLHFKK